MDTVEQQDQAGGAQVARRPRVRRNVTAAIAEDIFSDRYPAGSPLPRENDLCDLHGVSRTVIRESLKVLESKGMVRRTHGGAEQREAADGGRVLCAAEEEERCQR